MADPHTSRSGPQSWRESLRTDLEGIRRQDLMRSLRPVDRCARVVSLNGRSLVNLAGNDYLGLATHPHLQKAAIEAIGKFGTSSGASRLLSGNLEIHQQLEQRFALFKRAEAALLFPTGYMANLAVPAALAGPGDLILMDKLCHASLVDGARASGARLRVWGHKNLQRLRSLLERESTPRRRLIVTESVFSMDGDCADLPALLELARAYGAILVVDEAHATGLMGPTGAGLAEHQGVLGSVDVTISTAGKGLGGMGGIVTADQLVIQTLVNRARPFIYATAPPPAQSAVIGAALDLIRDEPHRRQRLVEIGARLRQGLRRLGWPVEDVPTPIIPLGVGESSRALALAKSLEEAGFFAPAIRPPTVPRGKARVRLSLRWDLEDLELDRLLAAVGAAPGT